MYMPVGLI